MSLGADLRDLRRVVRVRACSTMRSRSVVVVELGLVLQPLPRPAAASCNSAASAFSRPGDVPLLLDALRRHVAAERCPSITPARRSRDASREMSLALEQLVALLVDHLALVVGDVVVFEQLLADVEVARLDLALRVLDRARDHAVLDRLAFGHLQPLHDRADALAGEDAQQRILERQVEARAARVALAAGAAAQLVVDAPRLVALGADDVQAAGGDHLVVQLLPFARAASSICALLLRGVERLVVAQLEDRRLRRCRPARCRCRGRPCWWRW